MPSVAVDCQLETRETSRAWKNRSVLGKASFMTKNRLLYYKIACDRFANYNQQARYRLGLSVLITG